MKKVYLKNLAVLMIPFTALFFIFPTNAEAQRMNHAGASKSRPAASRPASQAKSINGGRQKSVSRPASKNTSPKKSTVAKRGDAGSNINSGNRTNTVDKSKINAGNKTNVGNKVNIDNSKKNVNINVDNSTHINRNTSVRRNSRPYARPPYRYGGRSFYCYHPYYYHPFRPFVWGPMWHPWGFFITTLAATAIIVSIENQQYHYDQGVFYVSGNGGYTSVTAPVGATVTTIPQGAQTVVVNETTNNYYYGGTYYEKDSGGYTVVPPTSGTVVENLPEGGEEVKIDDVTYVKLGETYYQPIQQDGKNMYEVVEIEEDKS